MASDSHQSNAHLKGGRIALVGGSILTVLAFAGAAIVTQMSGCCGSAPTHGCKFVETHDAATESSSDAMLPCGFEICQPGVTTCCLEAQHEPPIRCIPLNQVCEGPSRASCSGDQDCPVGAGLHCCGTLETMSVQCQASCSGNPTSDGTLRICRVDAECPPDLPKCLLITVTGQSFFACRPQPT